MFARFGGDEFALLLPETDGTIARQVVGRVRSAIATQPHDLEGISVNITISAGITSLRSKTDTVDMLIVRADQALYQAIEMGRNGVVLLTE